MARNWMCLRSGGEEELSKGMILKVKPNDKRNQTAQRAEARNKQGMFKGLQEGLCDWSKIRDRAEGGSKNSFK